MTRFLFSFSFLLLSLMMGVRAQTIEDFSYSKYSNTKTITINYCKHPSTDITIPATAIIDGNNYNVTTIEGVCLSNNTTTKSIYVPSSVTKYTGPIVHLDYATTVKSIVIENGSFSIKSNTYPIYTDYASTRDLDNIIVLSPCRKVSSELSNKDAYLYKAGEIKVEVTNKEDVVIQMFLYGKNEAVRFAFGNERLDYLLSALQKHGIDLNDIESIDLSQMSQNGETINFDNLTDSPKIPNAQVITQKTTINDMADNYTPQAFTGLISYSRSNTAGWNTVCLPFDVKESDFPTGTEIYQMSSDTEDAIYLSRIEEGTKLLAGTPCFIWSPQGTDTWNLNIQGSIAADISAGTSELEHWTLIGSFNKKPLDAGYYKLNSAGDAFVKTVAGTSHVYPFRCYIAPTPNNSSAPARLGMGIDEEATITLVPDDRAPQQVKLYDLMGRPRQGNAAGLFVPSKR